VKRQALLVTAVAPSAVDLTWASLQAAAMVSNWQVEASYFAEQSDHTCIEFNLSSPSLKSPGVEETGNTAILDGPSEN